MLHQGDEEQATDRGHASCGDCHTAHESKSLFSCAVINARKSSSMAAGPDSLQRVSSTRATAGVSLAEMELVHDEP